ncbi:MAG: hypothetical protein HZC15_00575 [Candidatus Omnitrophica bacterium]|nr:hypothetical protein [Candidatus Omnitrophota bacterium]
MKIPGFLEKFTSINQDENVPLSYYILSFLGIINLRNFLEIFSDTAMVPFSIFSASDQNLLMSSVSIGISFFHYTLFWASSVLLFSIVFSLITSDTIQRSLRSALSLVCAIGVITPIIDLIISKGKGIDISYVYPEKLQNLIFFSANITPGETITALLSMILSILYFLTKTKSLAKTLVGAIAIYTILLVSTIIPLLTKITCLSCQNGFSIITMIRFLTILIFIETFILLMLGKNELLKIITQQIKTKTIMQLILLFLIGMAIYQARVEKMIFADLGGFILILITIYLGFTIYTLLKSPQATNRQTSLFILFFLAILASTAVNFTTVFFLTLSVGSFFIYFCLPLKLSRVYFISKALVSFNLILLIMLGWLFSGGEILNFPHIFSFYILIFFTGCLNIQEIESKPKIRFIISSFFLIAYCLLGFLFLEPRLIIPCSAVGIIQFFLVHQNPPKFKNISSLYLLTLAAIFIWLNFLRIYS